MKHEVTHAFITHLFLEEGVATESGKQEPRDSGDDFNGKRFEEGRHVLIKPVAEREGKLTEFDRLNSEPREITESQGHERDFANRISHSLESLLRNDSDAGSHRHSFSTSGTKMGATLIQRTIDSVVKEPLEKYLKTIQPSTSKKEMTSSIG